MENLEYRKLCCDPVYRVSTTSQSMANMILNSGSPPFKVKDRMSSPQTVIEHYSIGPNKVSKIKTLYP